MKEGTRVLFRKLWHYLPFSCFVSAILCLCFIYGVAVGKWHLFPRNFLNAGWDSLKALRNRSKLPHFIHSARYEGEGVVVYDHEQVYPGVTLVTGLWKDGKDWDVGIHLVDFKGRYSTNGDAIHAVYGPILHIMTGEPAHLMTK
jgi:hypothetical protein